MPLAENLDIKTGNAAIEGVCTMTDERHTEVQRRRKPLWPWLLLLIFTLVAIYSWNRANEIFDEFSRNLPPAIGELFRDLLNERRNAQPGLDVHTYIYLRS